MKKNKTNPVGVKFKGFVVFDRSIIKSNWKKINEHPLKKAGLMVRKFARQSIRRAKKGGKPGPVGSPPKSRVGGATPPFKMIFSVPEGFTRTVVGMVGFGGGGSLPPPGLQEHGGTATRQVFVDGPQRRTKKGTYGKKTKVRTKKTVRYPQRPFMFPALKATRTKLPGLWEGSLNQ